MNVEQPVTLVEHLLHIYNLREAITRLGQMNVEQTCHIRRASIAYIYNLREAITDQTKQEET
jgi:hypothetical protein